MKKTIIGLFLLLSLLMITNITKVKALEGDDEFTPVSETTKYYKTITQYNNGNHYSPDSLEPVSTQTIEITEAEYLNVGTTPEVYSPNLFTTVETAYKKMTTSIETNGSTYRYKNVLIWKNFPSVRSNDIIGIGFFGSVQPVANTRTFELFYCRTSNGCHATSAMAVKQTFTYGSSAVYSLPSFTDLISLKATYYFDVSKTNSSLTIVHQGAFGDYSHAITSVTPLQAINHEVVQNAGIYLDDSIVDKYDAIDEADVHWYGSW